MVDRPGIVRVRGANVPMNTEEPPEDETPPYTPPWGGESMVPYDWARERYGTPAAPTPPSERGMTWAELFPDSPLNPKPVVPQLPPAGTTDVMGGRGYIPGSTTPMNMTPVEEPASTTFQDFMMGRQFDESPYRNYMNFLATQDEETMARINAMYAQLADEAGANMQRIGDIYGSAQMTSGDVYGGSAQAVEGAYGSAQQQAADQMARLGIEAAAPAVINPMALSQAEAVAGIEAAGAGSLDALTRYGSSAQDFGSQMGQVAQQQGLEVSSQLLRDMQQRQAEAMFQMETARANYNPYAQALQELEAQNAWNQVNNPQVDPRQLESEAEFLYQQEQDDLNLMRQYYNLYYEGSNGNETVTRQKLLGAIEAGLLGERWRQWAAQNPGVLPPLA